MSNVTVKDTLEELSALDVSVIPHEQRFNINCTIDPPEVVRLIDCVLNSSESETAKEQGDRIEQLADYLLRHCGFLENVQVNVKNRQHEIDHFGELSEHVMTYFRGKDISNVNFIGESKNYSKKLDTTIVYKLEGIKLFTKAEVGAYFSRRGLTGETAVGAKGVLADFLLTFKKKSLVFAEEEWMFLRQYPKKFGSLFYKKFSIIDPSYDSKLDFKTAFPECPFDPAST